MGALKELHAEIFCIAFVAGVLGNLVASTITSIHLHWHLRRVNVSSARAASKRNRQAPENEGG